MRTERIPNSASLCPRERGGKSALLKKRVTGDFAKTIWLYIAENYSNGQKLH